MAEVDAGRKDLLLDIATEELSHLEVIGTIVGMLNKGAKGKLAEATEEQGEIYRSITGGGNDSHLTQMLYGGGPALVKSTSRPVSCLPMQNSPTNITICPKAWEIHGGRGTMVNSGNM